MGVYIVKNVNVPEGVRCDTPFEIEIAINDILQSFYSTPDEKVTIEVSRLL